MPSKGFRLSNVTSCPIRRVHLCYCNANPDHTIEDCYATLHAAAVVPNCPNFPRSATTDFDVVVDFALPLPREQSAVLVFLVVQELFQ